MRKRPYQVLLLDEIEKAHRDVLEAFLQVFDEGRMTDGRGRTIDFTNVVIVMTSNLGADVVAPDDARAHRLRRARPTDDAADAAYDEAVCAAARAALPPELYNRIDEVLAFAPLGRARRGRGRAADARRASATSSTQRAASASTSSEARDRGAARRTAASTPSSARARCAARLRRLVEAPIAEMLLKGELESRRRGPVDASNGTIAVRRISPRLNQQPARELRL